jgi:hypothetical protein
MIMVKVGDLVQRIEDDHTGQVLGGLTNERSGDAMCGLHSARGDEERGFFCEPQNQGGGEFPSLGLKTGSYGLVILTSKSPRRFFGLRLKIKWASVCATKPMEEGRRMTPVEI